MCICTTIRPLFRSERKLSTSFDVLHRDDRRRDNDFFDERDEKARENHFVYRENDARNVRDNDDNDNDDNERDEYHDCGKQGVRTGRRWK